MFKDYEKLINQKLFDIVIPEVYNRCIPKYFTQTHPGDLPMHNGRRMTWEEYQQLHPEAEKDEEFTPAMVYDPQSMNEAAAMEPIVTMIDLIDNDIPFSLGDPLNSYPEVIDIIKGYITLATPYAETNPVLSKYLEKARTTLSVINNSYTAWQARRQYKINGGQHDVDDDFDKISKRFITPED